MMQKEVADRISAKPNTQGIRQLVDCSSVLHDSQGCLYRTSYGLCTSAKCGLSYLKMVRRPEPAVAVKDENFFFKVSRLVLPIVARPCE